MVLQRYLIEEGIVSHTIQQKLGPFLLSIF